VHGLEPPLNGIGMVCSTRVLVIERQCTAQGVSCVLYPKHNEPSRLARRQRGVYQRSHLFVPQPPHLYAVHHRLVACACQPSRLVHGELRERAERQSKRQLSTEADDAQFRAE
jgi:hypothetical protein